MIIELKSLYSTPRYNTDLNIKHGHVMLWIQNILTMEFYKEII